MKAKFCLGVFFTIILVNITLKVEAQDLKILGLAKPDKAQISGLAMAGDVLLLLPQQENTLYWVRVDDVKNALKLGDGSIRVSAHTLGGDLPSFAFGSGWEAIATGAVQAQKTVFLAFEHSEGRHSIYSASIEIDSEGINTGRLQRRWSLPSTPRQNYAYESLVWRDGIGLLTVPEFSDASAVLFRAQQQPKKSPLQSHHYRISDFSAANSRGNRLLATSFCWRGESKRCKVSAAGDSQALLLCIRLGETTAIVDGELPLPLSVPGEDGEFNAESIVLYGSGIIVVNDNSPGQTQSTLRYLASPNIQRFRAECLEP